MPATTTLLCPRGTHDQPEAGTEKPRRKNCRAIRRKNTHEPLGRHISACVWQRVRRRLQIVFEMPTSIRNRDVAVTDHEYVFPNRGSAGYLLCCGDLLFVTYGSDYPPAHLAEGDCHLLEIMADMAVISGVARSHAPGHQKATEIFSRATCKFSENDLEWHNECTPSGRLG